MATSGATRFTLNKLIDHAIRRCQIPGQAITSENQQIVKECLTLVLAGLQNEKMPLWCQEAILVPMYEAEAQARLPDGTIDILSAFYRTLPRAGDAYNSAEGVAANLGDGDLATSCVQTSIDGFYSIQYFNRSAVTMVGFMPNGNQFHNLVFEASDDSLSWTLVQTITPPSGKNATPYLDKKWYWYEVLSPANALFFRVRETGGGVLNFRELVTSLQPQDILMAPLNRDQYTYLPNKTFQGGGRPLQYWLKRDLDEPIMYLWPVPSSADTFNCMYVWRRRYINDVGDFNATIEIPLRWYDAICWKLAHYAAMELKDVPPDAIVRAERNSVLMFSNVKSEERNPGPVILRPNIRRYTR